MIEKINFWCNKILPLVYDNSLSYYEVLCKVKDAINALIDANNELQAEWIKYQAKTEQELMDYILQYLTDEKIAEIVKNIELFYVDCSDYCLGDGTTDDTENLKSAIAVCKETKKPLYIGDGKYIISNTVALGNDLTIIGYNTTPGEDEMSAIIVNMCNENTPLFTFGKSVTIKNLMIDEPKNDVENQAPYNYGYVFYSDFSTDCYFENVYLNRCTNGIKTVTGGRNIYTNIKMGCFNNDFWIENRTDSDEYNNLHLWPFGFKSTSNLGKYRNTNCTHIIIVNSDDMVFNNVFAYGGKCMFELGNGGNGRGPWVSANGVTADVLTGNALKVTTGFYVNFNDVYISSAARPRHTAYMDVNNCSRCNISNVNCVSNPFVPIITGNATVNLTNVSYTDLDHLLAYKGSLNGQLQNKCPNPLLQINGSKWKLGSSVLTRTISLTTEVTSTGTRFNTETLLGCHPQVLKIVCPSNVDIFISAGEYEQEKNYARVIGGTEYYVPILGAYPLFNNFGTYLQMYGSGGEDIVLTIYDADIVDGAALNFVSDYWRNNNGEISLMGQNFRYKCATQPATERCKNGDIYVSPSGEQKVLINGVWS